MASKANALPAKPKRGKQMAGEPGVFYGRYSSHSQRDISIEQQYAKCAELAIEYGIQIVARYSDRAVSGRTDNRTDFRRMMRDASKGLFRYVIAWKSNRMGRNMLEALVNEATLQDLGIRVLYVEEDFDDTAAGRFAARSMMNVNQFYSENMAEDIVRGLEDNATKCMVNGSLPYGYKNVDSHYAIDKPKDEIVQEIFNRVACGHTLADIAADLNARCIKTKTGGPWGKNSFRTILMNERYRGVYIYGDVRIEGGVPRIIGDDLFYTVQEVLRTKKNARGAARRSTGDYLLTGKLFCGNCKSTMVGTSGTSMTGELHYYYVCQQKRSEHTCNKKNVRRDVIETAVANAIRDNILQDDVIEHIAEESANYLKRQADTSPVALLESELAETQTAIKNVMKAIEAGIITETTRGRLLELESQQTRLTAQIAAAKADIIVIGKDEIKAGLMVFRDGNLASKKFRMKLFNTFLVAVFLYDDRLEIQFSYFGNKAPIAVPMDFSGETSADDVAGAKFVQSPLCSTKKPRLSTRFFH